MAYSTDSLPNRGPAVFAVVTATLMVGTFFLIARLICRSIIVKRISCDDYFIILAWVLAVGLSVTIDIGTIKGLGRHDQDIAAQDRLPLKKTGYVFSVLYNPALMALKTSMLVFYLRLSKNTQRALRIASWAVLVTVNLAGLTLTLINIFQCRPVWAAFSLYRDEKVHCIPLLTAFICSAPINIVTDLAILTLPLPVLTSMRLPKRQKYILVFTFSLGAFVTIIDVVRIYYLQQAISYTSVTPSDDPMVHFGESPQFPWNASFSLMWSAVEVNIGMICACIPTLKPLIIKILPAVLVDPDGAKFRSTSHAAATQDTEAKEPQEPQEAQEAGIEAHMNHEASPNRVAVTIPTHQQGSSAMDSFMLDFLTTPDMIHPPLQSFGQGWAKARFSRAKITWLPSGLERHESDVYFGFVNVKRPKSMIHTSLSESTRYCIVVTILFIMWGFSYGLLNTLNNSVASIASMSIDQTLGLTAAYWGAGYFFGPLIMGQWILRHDEHARFHHHRRRHQHRDFVGGFKATFIAGLCIYGTGTIMFWPSAVLTSFTGFALSNFVVGFGLAVLETAANPFIILCGPRKYAEVRILISQGFQGTATVLSGLLAQKVFFTHIGRPGSHPDATQLIDVQWAYLAITIFCGALGLFFYYMPLPEVSEAELERAADRIPVDSKKRCLGGLQLRTWCIILAVMAQWAYVSAQESMSVYFKRLLTVTLPVSSLTSDHPAGLALSTSDYLLISHSVFALSRFNSAHMAWLSVKLPRTRFIPTPRTQLAIHSATSAFLALICVVIRPSNPNLMALTAVLFFFAEGPIWPLIFALGLQGQGNRTKRASIWLTMAASGAGLWPFVIHAIETEHDTSVQVGFIIVVVLFLFTAAYPVFLTVVKDARDLVNPMIQDSRAQRRFVGAGGGLGGGENPDCRSRDVDGDTDDMDLRQRSTLSSARTESTCEHGALAFVMGKLNHLGKKKDDKKRQASSSTATTGSLPLM